MNRKLSLFIIATVAAASALTGCNKSDSDDENQTIDLTNSTMVTNFSLASNRKILANLDSVYFTIDLVGRRIFNADSLPYGTDVSRLIVEVKVPNSATLRMDMVSRFTGSDTTVNLTDNPRDSINFTDGTNWLRVTAPDGNQATYSVKVNVHRVLPDSLRWSKTGSGALPGTIATPTAQRTVRFGSELLCLIAGSRRTVLCSTATPYDFDSWQQQDVTLPEGALVNTFTATADALYIVCADGSLHRAADKSLQWTEAEPAGSGWTHLYGGFADRVVGVRGSEWATCPESASGSLADLGADFPVAQTSQLISFTSDWNVEPQAIMAGGLRADGAYTGATWAFDGRTWFRLTSATGVRSLPAGPAPVIFPYFTFTTSTNWTVTKRATWIALTYSQEGTSAATSAVYTSQDNGINWVPAPRNLHLPSSLAARYDAQAFVCPHTFEASRAVAPITEWDTDFVYVFGGSYFDTYSRSTRLYNQLWRGVVERLTFKPLQ